MVGSNQHFSASLRKSLVLYWKASPGVWGKAQQHSWLIKVAIVRFQIGSVMVVCLQELYSTYIMAMMRVYDCLAGDPCNTIPCSAASSDVRSQLVNIWCMSHVVCSSCGQIRSIS